MDEKILNLEILIRLRKKRVKWALRPIPIISKKDVEIASSAFSALYEKYPFIQEKGKLLRLASTIIENYDSLLVSTEGTGVETDKNDIKWQ